MSAITTHVLDVARGRPAAGVSVTLERDGGVVAQATTDDDGRVGSLGPSQIDPGTYRLRFATGDYFAADDEATFYPEVVVDFTVADTGQSGSAQHYHVPLLVSPFGYSTYRGS